MNIQFGSDLFGAFSIYKGKKYRYNPQNPLSILRAHNRAYRHRLADKSRALLFDSPKDKPEKYLTFNFGAVLGGK